MSSKESVKIAHVTECKGKYVLSLTKAAVTFVPRDMLFGARCTLMRDGVACNTLGVWNPHRNGIVARELNRGDTVHIEPASPEDFYLNLLRQDKKYPGLVVSMDPDLRRSLEPLCSTDAEFDS